MDPKLYFTRSCKRCNYSHESINLILWHFVKKKWRNRKVPCITQAQRSPSDPEEQTETPGPQSAAVNGPAGRSTNVATPLSYRCRRPRAHCPGKTRDFSIRAIIKYRNSLCVSKKIQWFSISLLQFFCVLHATSVSLGSNAVKLQV